MLAREFLEEKNLQGILAQEPRSRERMFENIDAIGSPKVAIAKFANPRFTEFQRFLYSDR